MKICVFGAGAVGGYLAARLIQAGRHDVSIVARGAHRDAIAANGLTLITPQEQFEVRPHAVTDTPAELPEQDLVFVTLKAHAHPAVASAIASLLGEHSVVVFVNNGIPWWWNYRGDASGAPSLPLLDPDGDLWRQVRPERTIGCVVYSANEVEQPGVVRHLANNHWVLGEPDGSPSERLQVVGEVMRHAGLQAETTVDIRLRVWRKLLRNAPLNSVCALTRLPVDQLAREPQLEQLCNAVIDEIAAIALADGYDLGDQLAAARSAISLGGAIDGSATRSVRPSMLQDVESGRSMEVQSILGQVQAFARASGTPCPTLDVLVALIRGLDIRSSS